MITSLRKLPYEQMLNVVPPISFSVDLCSFSQKRPNSQTTNQPTNQPNWLDNVHCVADDIIVHGTDEACLHAKLQTLLERCDEHGIRLNQQKCQFDVQEITFLGHAVTNDDLKPDPSKIEAVLEMDNPGGK